MKKMRGKEKYVSLRIILISVCLPVFTARYMGDNGNVSNRKIER